MVLRAVSANFGCASPAASGVQPRRRARADHHARELRDGGVDLVFAQEIPHGEAWISAWEECGYAVAVGGPPTYAVRSAVISRSDLGAEPLSIPSAGYHGSYVAAATIALDGPPITLVSVHASPSRLTADQVATGERLVGGRFQRNGEWWDSDFVLGTLALLGAEGQVIAAGDLNECVRWDDSHAGRWGAQYFTNVAEAGFTSATWEAWGEERQTYLGSDAGYQLDHVLVTSGLSGTVRATDLQRWDDADVASGESPDHAWIRFEVDPST